MDSPDFSKITSIKLSPKTTEAIRHNRPSDQMLDGVLLETKRRRLHVFEKAFRETAMIVLVAVLTETVLAIAWFFASPDKWPLVIMTWAFLIIFTPINVLWFNAYTTRSKGSL